MVACGMEKTTLYLPGELQRALVAMAKRESRSQADIIRVALEAYISSRAPLRLRSIGAGSDDKVTGANAEEWLRKNSKKKKLKTRKTGR